MKILIIIIIQLIVFLPLDASAYLGPGLGIGVSTLILFILFSILLSIIYLLSSFIIRFFSKEKKLNDRKKINLDD